MKNNYYLYQGQLNLKNLTEKQSLLVITPLLNQHPIDLKWTL